MNIKKVSITPYLDAIGIINLQFFHKIFKFFSQLDHKTIGLSYVYVGIVFGLIGTVLSTTIRLELLLPGYYFFSGSGISYNMVITSHGFIMIFFAVMPIFISGFGNFFIPLMVGTRDMALPKLNNLALLLLILSFLLFSVSTGYFGEGVGVSSGWTLYPPLSLLNSSGPLHILILALHVNGISSIINSINTISTIQFCSSVSKWNYSLFVWSILITSYLLLLVIPVLVVGITLLLLDFTLGSCFFSVQGGGDPVLFQHLFWFFGHPEVYILILPVFGLVSEFLAEYTSCRLLGYKVMIWSMISIAVLGCLVWAHHMFTIGMEVDSKCYFSIATSIIAIPTGLKVFLWLSSIINSRIKFNIVSILILLFIINFVLGGITGVWLAQSGLDLLLHDTYFVVAHFHYVMAISILYIFFAAIYNWYTFFYGLSFNLFYSKLHVLTFFIGVNLLFFPMHFLGIYGMPRRVFDYPSIFEGINGLSSIGLFIVLISLLFFSLSLANFKFKKLNRIFFYVDKVYGFIAYGMRRCNLEKYEVFKLMHLIGIRLAYKFRNIYNVWRPYIVRVLNKIFKYIYRVIYVKNCLSLVKFLIKFLGFLEYYIDRFKVLVRGYFIRLKKNHLKKLLRSKTIKVKNAIIKKPKTVSKKKIKT